MNVEYVEDILNQVMEELFVATERFPNIASPHEGKAVIEEELDELWELVKANKGDTPEAMHEASQIAAMAARYVLDLGVIEQPRP